MNVSHSATGRDDLIDIVAVVTRASDGGVLILKDGRSCGLPHIRMSRSDFRLAPHLNEAMADKFGLETTVLRCLFQRMSEDQHVTLRAYAFEQHGDRAAPEVLAWVRRDGVESLNMSSEVDRNALHAWMAGQASDEAVRCPWSVAGWWDEAVGWIDRKLAGLDFSRTGAPEQKRAWSLSSIVRSPTSAGHVYFKAVPSFMAHEGAAMAAMSEAYSSMTPPPLAADGLRGWLLMSDFGGRWLGQVPDIDLWEQAVNTHARMQVEQAERTGYWLELGCPDRSLGRMVELIDPLITVSTRILSGRADGLSSDEIDALQGLGMRLKFMCAQLADFRIPHSLVHGDLGGNIIVKNDGDFVFFDWTDVCVSHPFFDMTTMVNTIFDDNPFQGDEGAALRMRNAYLEPWTKHAPIERLVQAYDASRTLGALHQAMSYMWILTNIAEDARWELEGGLRQWLKNVLALCGV